MDKTLRALIIEDCPDDAELVLLELERSGLKVEHKRVETAEQLIVALEDGDNEWDVIIADFSLPHFSAPEALKIVKQRELFIPFIIVSGTIGEETAVEMMREGANDYLIKDRLKRLPAAIRSEIRKMESVRKARKMQEELRSAKQFSDKIISSMKEGFSILDKQGVHLRVNEAFCKMTGFSKDELVGTVPPHPYWPEEEYENIKEVFEKASNGQFEDAELIFERKNGERFYVIISPSCVRDENGEVLSYFASARDITKRKESEKKLEETLEELRRSNEELRQFTHIASHDLREPVRKIISFAELLTESLATKLNDDEKEYLQFMTDNADRIMKVTKYLTRYLRTDNQSEIVQSIDLNIVIDEIKKTQLAARIEKSDANIEVVDNLPKIFGIYSQIFILLNNIIDNALTYTPKNISPKIKLKAIPETNNFYRIEIADNGVGIEEEYQAKIFEMFSRLHPDIHYKGTGIGLAFCKKIVELHGGEIGVDSTPGKGSTFWFTLPSG